MTTVEIFNKRLDLFEAELLRQNIRASRTEGYRSMARQKELYDQGRTKPGKRVTNAKPGQSPHNYGLAQDYVPVVSGKRTFNVKMKWWSKFGKAAKKVGLEWGGYWKAFQDKPHVQMPNWRKYR